MTRHLRIASSNPVVPDPEPLTRDEQAAADALAGEMALEAAMNEADPKSRAILYAVARLSIAKDREGLEGVDRILRDGAHGRSR